MGKKENLQGKRYGRLTVIKEVGRYSNGGVKWMCKCDCGNTTFARGDSLKTGKAKSCGCLSSDSAKMHLEGQRFGYLTVVRDAKRNKYGNVLWECKCDCGNTTLVTSSNLSHGYVKSCGCMKDKMIGESNKKHGLCETKLYSVWAGMKCRCNNPNDSHYHCYGGKGIKVCEKWANDFMSFYEWAMENGFEEDLTIDRVDVNKGYAPDNCRWVTNNEQQRNKCNTIYLSYKGDKKPLREWGEIKGINHATILSRLKRGWTIEKALETPPKQNGRRKVNVSA